MIVDVIPMADVTCYTVAQVVRILKVVHHSVRYVLRNSLRYIGCKDPITDAITVPLGSVERLVEDKKAGLVLKNAERVA